VTADIPIGMVLVTGGISYTALSVFIWRNCPSIWLRINLGVLTLTAAAYGCEAGSGLMFDFEVPKTVLRIQRALVSINGITAMFWLLGFLKGKQYDNKGNGRAGNSGIRLHGSHEDESPPR
jgi:energy-converting hydrogenase Eha subunit G